jgi:hypothetical protein
VTRSAAFFASLLVSLGRPAWWVLALAGFLARGGIILAVLPIVRLPSPLGLSDIFAPAIIQLRLGRIDVDVIAAIVGVAAAIVACVVIGGLLGAATDLALIRDGAVAAADEGATDDPVGRRTGDSEAQPMSPPRPTSPSGGFRVVGRVLVVRLAAHLPFEIAVAIGTVAIVNVTYAELTRPEDVATPLVIRVIAGAALPIGGTVVAWLLGELAGGPAARRVVLENAGFRDALGGAVAALVLRPRSTLVPWIVTTVALVVIVIATLGGARIAWLRADAALTDSSIDAVTLVVTLMTFVAIWLAALALIGLVAATRSVALTFEAVRDAAQRLRSATSRDREGGDVGGTFGASTHHRPGDRPVGGDGGSL